MKASKVLLIILIISGICGITISGILANYFYDIYKTPISYSFAKDFRTKKVYYNRGGGFGGAPVYIELSNIDYETFQSLEVKYPGANPTDYEKESQYIKDKNGIYFVPFEYSLDDPIKPLKLDGVDKQTFQPYIKESNTIYAKDKSGIWVFTKLFSFQDNPAMLAQCLESTEVNSPVFIKHNEQYYTVNKQDYLTQDIEKMGLRIDKTIFAPNDPNTPQDYYTECNILE